MVPEKIFQGIILYRHAGRTIPHFYTNRQRIIFNNDSGSGFIGSCPHYRIVPNSYLWLKNPVSRKTIETKAKALMK